MMREGWINIELGKLCSFSQGIQVPIKNQFKEPHENRVRFLRIIDFTQGNERPRYIEKSNGHHLVKKHDISMVRYGTVGFVCTGKEGAIANNLFRIIPDVEIENRYLVEFFKSSFFRQHLDPKGATMQALSFGLIKPIMIPLPPLPEQRAIVAKIEQLFSELDNGIANLKAAKAKLAIYRQAVLKKAFEGELTKEWWGKNQSAPWKKLRISEIGEIVTGNTPSKKNASYYSSNEYPFYKPTDLEAGSNVKYSIDGLSKEGFETGRMAAESSILVTCIGATIGKTGLIKRKGCFNQQINAIIPDERMDSKYIYYQAISVDFQNQIKTNASATTLPILNKGKFSILEMAICPLKEQKQIVQEIETRLSVCDNILRNIEEGLEKAEALRQSILKKAFEGKLLNEIELAACRQQPDWEPAEKLLARIRRDAMHRVSTTKRAPTHEWQPRKQNKNQI